MADGNLMGEYERGYRDAYTSGHPHLRRLFFVLGFLLGLGVGLLL
jgi:hypothetical protein